MKLISSMNTLHLLPLLLLVSCLPSGQAQRRQYIQDIIQNLKTLPKSNRSPSFSGDRNFDLIGTGGLPLQGSEVQRPDASFQRAGGPNERAGVTNERAGGDAPSIKDVITGSLSRFENSNHPFANERATEKRPDTSRKHIKPH